MIVCQGMIHGDVKPANFITGTDGSVKLMDFGESHDTHETRMTTRNDNPKAASRPFDADRDGFVMSDGSAALVLEDYAHAMARGAKIYGEIVGYGMTCDAHHITSPTPGGVGDAEAMRLALSDARLEPDYRKLEAAVAALTAAV